MRVLQELEPQSVFYYFEEISAIPHVSYFEQELSDYCVEFAKERGLEHYQDELGNVIIIKEATKGYENASPIIIQGHLDMVGDQTSDNPIDMETESITLLVEGDYVTADRTTLGGDDGIAVAYALAILDAKDIPHPRLEVVLTVSEEVGLEGATGIDLSPCKGRRLINIDSEEEGVITVGCAGGVRAVSRIPVEREEITGVLYKLYIEGLLGGHSGIEIGEGRANANQLLGRFFLFLKGKMNYRLKEMYGGVKDNVIPKEAQAAFVIDKADANILEETLAEFMGFMKAEYGVTDPGIHISVVPVKEDAYSVVTLESQDKVLTALNLMPGGVQTMSADVKGLVETSLNMGVMDLTEKRLEMNFALRSSVPSAKVMLQNKIEQLTGTLGGSMTLHGDYPSWEYVRESKFRDLCMDVYKDMYGKDAKIEIIHAGLECGILSNKLLGLECISIGPDMFDVHSPNEKISISSIARVWDYLKAILAAK